MFNFSSLFGWGRKIRGYRRRWDRLRERTLKKPPAVRATLLFKEDQIEQNIAALEERRLTRAERARIARSIELDLAELKAMMKAKPEEFRQQSQVPAPPEKKQ